MRSKLSRVLDGLPVSRVRHCPERNWADSNNFVRAPRVRIVSTGSINVLHLKCFPSIPSGRSAALRHCWVCWLHYRLRGNSCRINVLSDFKNGRKKGEFGRLAEWNKIKPVFVQNGWTVFKESRAGGFLKVLQYTKNGVQACTNMDNDAAFFRLDVIEIAPLPFTLTLTPSAATPEKIAADKGDFPYLAPLPGSKFHRGGADNTPFRVQPPGAEQAEVVANGTLYRDTIFPRFRTCCWPRRIATYPSFTRAEALCRLGVRYRNGRKFRWSVSQYSRG